MISPQVRVLYIDDEDNNLQAFKATFRRQYEVYTAISAAEGLKILESIEIHVIVADQKMPNLTGVEFFKRISVSHPDAVRILLTGYTDIEALADAINHGHIYRYITKPWSELDLHSSIKNAYEAYRNKIDLRNKIIELEKTNNELNRFIYSISHELRAPLVSVMGIINLVKMEGLYDSAGEYWPLTETCANRLDYYIQKTLQYYKNAKGEIEKSEVDFKAVVGRLVDFHGSFNKEIDIKVNVIQDVKFIGDAFRIEVILGNLISNAVTYQKQTAEYKNVNIDIVVNASEALISINDNGMGILKEHLDKIFTQFFKSKMHQHGSGLGLFIVKEALQLINGNISVSSSIEDGTTFKIRIPNATY
jgi:two-component system response regulator PhcR